MNFSKGILESRQLHYKHLSKLLRPIPLNTPTEIELTPRLSIRVTLLDANHCTGAVMFLIEGDGKAILYTGDIRAEPWWVNSIIRHPVLIPYTLGGKQLDQIYLDNTFARPAHVCHTFPSKAEGVAELLRKVGLYPANTTFYFRAWTFGYEEVWMALSAALNSKIHVDRYQMDLYRALVSQNTHEAPFLCGYALGNQYVPGCLSEDEQCRIHSCEPGVHCSVAASKNTVYIAPIVNRTGSGSEMPEIGAGGGGGDLYQVHELELPDQSTLEQLEKLCLERIHDTQALSQTRQALADAFQSKSKALSLDSYGMKDAHDMSLESLVNILSRGRLSQETLSGNVAKHADDLRDKQGNLLPKIINFPYSRHSSYAELCDLIAAFKPKDIHPCTVDPVTWDEDVSMQTLFGHLCPATSTFAHDQHMREITSNDPDLRARKRARYEHNHPSSTQSSQQSSSMMDNIGIPDHPKLTPTIISQPQPPASSERIPSLNLIEIKRTSSPPLPPSSTTTPSHPNEPLTLPTPTPATAKARRDEIRHAWNFLNNASSSQRELYQLDSLPSSWPTDDENPAVPVSEIDMTPYPADNPYTEDRPYLADSQLDGPARELVIPMPMPISSRSRHATTSPTQTPTPIPETPIYEQQQPALNPHDNTHTQTQTHTQTTTTTTDETTHSQTLSLPSSAFLSQDQAHEPISISSSSSSKTEPDPEPESDLEPESASDSNSSNKSEETTEDDHDHDHDQDQDHNNPQPRHRHKPRQRQRHKHRPGLPRTSTQLRRDAYLAARADSFEAWATVSLISTGNNHTEEEMEL
ncbi:hypothetical protein BO70DRAFT_379437 [Aspergillus heteromorphus CBS 117.55]|uniref:Protein artemis n=1 Tax=Aspergillus heteromorphus CBS 117.55 TaxID=1448321 RepID=A0A317W8D3_9EURO|nr:uncharacterized protein BO70DRAFT_379437 [Aspergillus heteromorphus CBS 117.55]PWY82874.1 hypothetical protein BO70DRAFT_379437 [Aspergillus heteromorphus CBS 117.55]